MKKPGPESQAFNIGINMTNRIYARWDFIRKPALYALLLVMLAGRVTTAGAAEWDAVKSLIGSRDAILVSDPAGQILVRKNENRKLIPASILKIFTSLAALHYLGPEYRYRTEFYLDDAGNLKIKGYGDPLLISEIVNNICRQLVPLVGSSPRVNDLIVDDSFFSHTVHHSGHQLFIAAL